jgi:LuxR family maltose regulon positive regulatory protein
VPSPRRGGQCFVASLAEIVDRQSDRVWLVPDDFQELRPPEGLRAKGLLLRWMPRNLRVIICSRRYPQVGLHRLRIAGQPREIRAGNLAFSRDEAEDVLASHGVNLPDEALSLSV